MKHPPLKHLIFVALFLVTWKELQMVCVNCGSSLTLQIIPDESKVYAVKKMENSITLATQKDVDLFLGFNYWDKSSGGNGGLIGASAIDIHVKEIKDGKK